jgi:predicted nucleotidyltransferase
MVDEKDRNILNILGIADIKKAIQLILWKYPIKRASLFGSYARQEANIESDIDI